MVKADIKVKYYFHKSISDEDICLFISEFEMVFEELRDLKYKIFTFIIFIEWIIVTFFYNMIIFFP